MKYLTGSLLVIVCMLIVLICIPFEIIGDLAEIVAKRTMQIGDRLDKWIDDD